MSVTRILTGARWSSAVRCPAKAIYEGLGTEPDPDTPNFMERHFKRGVNVGNAWAAGEKQRLEAEGHEVTLEAEVPWGDGWVGHVDMLDHTAKVAYEAYHAAHGEFREVKALQVAGYCQELGPEWTAELAVIDTTDVSDEDGFAVQPYAVNPAGLADRVTEIKERVHNGVVLRGPTATDKVSDSPWHSECRSCPFANTCHADWQPAHVEELPEFETLFDRLRIEHGDLQATEAKAKAIKERMALLKEEIRPVLQVGIPVSSGGVTVKLSQEKAPRVSFKLADYLRAGHLLPGEALPFVSTGSEPVTRWSIKAGE